MTGSPFVWGVVVGAVAYWFLYGAQPTTQVHVGGISPKPLRREGRRLKGIGGRSRPAYWPFGTTKG